MWQYFQSTFQTQLWLWMLFVLAVSSIYQGVMVWLRRLDWSHVAHPASRRLAVAVRLYAGLVLLVVTGYQICVYTDRFWYWEAYTRLFVPWPSFPDYVNYLTLFSTLACVAPINAVRLEFSQTRWVKFALWLLGIVLMVLTVVYEAMPFVLVNSATDYILSAINSYVGSWEQEPWYLDEFRQQLWVYNWRGIPQLLPFGVLFFAVAWIGLFIVSRMARDDRKTAMRWSFELFLLIAVLIATLVVSVVVVWPRLNPFLSWQRLASDWIHWPTIVGLSLFAGIIVAWMFSFRDVDDFSIAPDAEPFASLQQPRQILIAFVSCWIIVHFVNWPDNILSCAMLLIAVRQLVEFPENRGRLQGIQMIKGRVFCRNWLLFSFTLPVIATLMLTLGVILLSGVWADVFGPSQPLIREIEGGLQLAPRQAAVFVYWLP